MSHAHVTTGGPPRYTVTLDDMARLAEARGGRVLSSAYRGDAHDLEWECAAGHVWSAPPNRIKAGRWCRRCGNEARRARPTTRGLAAPRREARRRGGQLLSDHYVKLTANLRWRCADGHEWEACWGNVRKGTWCSACAGTKPVTLASMLDLARSRGGACLADAIRGNKVKVPWRCGEGHVWMATPAAVARGTWCPTCRRPSPTSAAEQKRIARARGGRCIEPAATARSHAIWACARGHEWSAVPDSVKRGAWCATCYLPERPSLAQLRRVAAAKGGKVVSRVYIDDRTPLEWRCRAGHTWWATPNAVKAGRWCWSCAHESLRGVPRPSPTIEDLRAIAEARGGRCVSAIYRGAKFAHDWACAEGHVWSAPHNSIRKGSWCPECDRHRRRRRELLAVERGPLAAPPERVVGLERRVARRRPLP